MTINRLDENTSNFIVKSFLSETKDALHIVVDLIGFFVEAWGGAKVDAAFPPLILWVESF